MPASCSGASRWPVRVPAQSLTGSISGAVADAQGGVLPGADVTLTNQSSKTTQRTVTNTDGVFVFASVPAGTYSVKVELSGFTAWEATDIVMRLGERRTVTGIKLAVGGVDRGHLGDVAARDRADRLGRKERAPDRRADSERADGRPIDRASCSKLLPGMTPISGGSTSNNPGYNGEIIGINGNGDGGKQSAVGNFSGNGTRADALDIVIDGAHASDPGCNCATSVNPNPDMVGEFKVLQSNYGAEHAKGPITIDVISKAGGRDFHGMGYLYLRDYRWNSNEWRLNKFSHRGRRREQAEEQVRLSRLQPRRPAAHPRHRASTRTATRSSSSPATSSTSSGSTPASCSRGCRPRRCSTATSRTPRQFSALGNSFVSTTPTNLVNGRIPGEPDRSERPGAS